MSLLAKFIAAGERLHAIRRERAAELAKSSRPLRVLTPMPPSARNTAEARAARKAMKLALPHPKRSKAERKRRRQIIANPPAVVADGDGALNRTEQETQPET